MKKSSKHLRAHYDLALEIMQTKEPDERRCLKLLREGAKSGDPRAGYALATWYLFGRAGLQKDLTKAIELLKTASQGKVPEAMFDLAVCFETGEGVRRNLTRAAMLYLEAGLRGEKQAIFEVGRCYYHGIGVPKNRRMAAIWLDRARELGISNEK